jgi:DNA-directed RNA polymerase subunit RPC12/RpoP
MEYKFGHVLLQCMNCAEQFTAAIYTQEKVIVPCPNCSCVSSKILHQYTEQELRQMEDQNPEDLQ